MRNWFLDIALLTLVLLVGIAMWQFYSLTWGDGPNGGYTAGRQERTFDQVTPAARPVRKLAPPN